MSVPPPGVRRTPPRRRFSVWPGILLALAVGSGGIWLVRSMAQRPGAMDPAMPDMTAPAAPAGR